MQRIARPGYQWHILDTGTQRSCCGMIDPHGYGWQLGDGPGNPHTRCVPCADVARALRDGTPASRPPTAPLRRDRPM